MLMRIPKTTFIFASTMDVPPGTVIGELVGPTGSSICYGCSGTFHEGQCPRCGTHQFGTVRLLLVAGKRLGHSPEHEEGAQGKKTNKPWTERYKMPRWARPMRM